MTSIIGFVTPTQKFDLDHPQLLMIQKAIHEKRADHICYHGYQRDDITERDVEAHQLFYSDGLWYLEGYCRLRKEVRALRLSLIEKSTTLQETFFTKRTGKGLEQKKVEIRIRFTKGVARWVRERQYYAFQSEETLPDGIVMKYAVHDVSEMEAWIGLGCYGRGVIAKGVPKKACRLPPKNWQTC